MCHLKTFKSMENLPNYFTIPQNSLKLYCFQIKKVFPFFRYIFGKIYNKEAIFSRTGLVNGYRALELDQTEVEVASDQISNEF